MRVAFYHGAVSLLASLWHMWPFSSSQPRGEEFKAFKFELSIGQSLWSRTILFTLIVHSDASRVIKINGLISFSFRSKYFFFQILRSSNIQQ